ncbi:MAG: hypothetical protein Q4E35_04655 [Eubacteriales bacterium]|nr:hypothetical protein [Eubacteriales bacterium]
MNTMKNPMLCGACIAVCTVSAAVMPSAGIEFILYLVVFLCCILCPVQYGLLCAVLAPLCASLLSGALSGILLASSCAECCAAALLFSVLMKLIHTGKSHTDILISSLCAAAVGRIVNAIVSTLIFSDGMTTACVWSWFNIIVTIPQTVLLISSVEIIYSLLVSAGLTVSRYG